MRVGAGQLTTFTGGFFMDYASKGLAGTALGFGIGGAALDLEVSNKGNIAVLKHKEK